MPFTDTDSDASPSADPHLDERIADCERRIAAYREALDAVRENPSASAEDLESLRESAGRQVLLTGPKPTVPDMLRIMGSRSGQTAERVRQEVLENYERPVKREEANLAQLRAKRERAGREAELRAERERLLYAIPEAHDAGLIIRYETMLTRLREKAIMELDRLQAWG